MTTNYSLGVKFPLTGNSCNRKTRNSKQQLFDSPIFLFSNKIIFLFEQKVMHACVYKMDTSIKFGTKTSLFASSIKLNKQKN